MCSRRFFWKRALLVAASLPGHTVAGQRRARGVRRERVPQASRDFGVAASAATKVPAQVGCLGQLVNLNQRDAGRPIRSADNGRKVARLKCRHNGGLRVVQWWNGRRDDLRLLIGAPIVV